MKTVAGVLVAFAVVAFWSQEARAQAVGYGTAADYDAAVGPPLYFIDFNGSTATVEEGSSFNPNVAFLSPESTTPTKVIWSSDAITDTGSTVMSNGVSNLAGVFAAPVRAFSFNYLSGSLVSVELRDASNAVIAVVPAAPGGFFGVVSTVPIKSFSMNHAMFTPTARDRLFIDNFQANVPNPTLEELHEAVCALIDLLDPATDMTHKSLHVNENRKNALENRCEAVGHALADCDAESAIGQLLSMRAQANGDGVNDWVAGPMAEALVDAIDALIAAILAHDCD
jgi:hypothetical protein